MAQFTKQDEVRVEGEFGQVVQDIEGGDFDAADRDEAVLVADLVKVAGGTEDEAREFVEGKVMEQVLNDLMGDEGDEDEGDDEDEDWDWEDDDLE